MRTYQIESPRLCNGFFRFSDASCLTCPFRVECESQFITEFGYSGRPSSVLKEYFYVSPFFYKVILPEKVSELYTYLVPKQLPSKMRQIIRRQLRVVYKMKVRSEVFQRWQVFALEEQGVVNYYSKLSAVNPYFDWFSDEQAKRIAFTVRSLITRVCNATPTCVISFESTGWFLNNLVELAQFEYDDFLFWVEASNTEGRELKEAISKYVDSDLSSRRIPFPLLRVPCVVVWQLLKENFLEVLAWLCRNIQKVRFVIVMFDDLVYFNLLQSYLFPLAIWKHETSVHFPYAAVMKVINPLYGKKIFPRREVSHEVQNFWC